MNESPEKTGSVLVDVSIAVGIAVVSFALGWVSSSRYSIYKTKKVPVPTPSSPAANTTQATS